MISFPDDDDLGAGAPQEESDPAEALASALAAEPALSSAPLDSSNLFCVIPIVVVDGKATIVSSSVLDFKLSRNQALNLAAWIIALADPDLDVLYRLLVEIRKK